MLWPRHSCARSEAALLASEARWRSIFETSTLAISVFDQDLRYRATNPAFQAILGYTDEELRQLTPLDLTVGEERGTADTRLTELREGKIDHYAVEKQYRRKDGKVIWAQASVARASQSGPEMFIGTMIDITESKYAQESLLATQSELARVSQLTTMGQMAASIAHEIKQPIASISMAASAGLRWLTRDPPNLKEVQTCLELIAKNGNRAHHVIDGIRAMFQKDRQEKEFLDVNQIIRDLLELVRGEAQKKRILLHSELSVDLQSVFGNRVQLQQVMLNLFLNAIEAIDAAANNIRQIRVSSTAFAPESILITVANSGPGFAPEISTISSTLFSRRSREAWEWVYRFAARSSRLTMGSSPRALAKIKEQSSRLHCRLETLVSCWSLLSPHFTTKAARRSRRSVRLSCSEAGSRDLLFLSARQLLARGLPAFRYRQPAVCFRT